MFDHDPLNLAAIAALPKIPPMGTVAMPVWHLFMVSDGTNIRLLSGESASADKAEELVTACAVDEFDFNPERTGCEYIGVIDRDVNIGVQEA